MPQEPITIRKSTGDDFAAVDALFRRSYPVLLARDYAPDLLSDALPVISRANPELLSSGDYYLAEREGQVLGAGGYSSQAPQGGQSEGVAHIRHVVTDADATRQGIGRALMVRIFCDAIRRGVWEFDCLSTRSAVRFYASLGFRVRGNILINLRPGISFPAVHMVRPG